jgi:hypothetical protein
MAKSPATIPVVVTTQHRGVFFGDLSPVDRVDRSLTLKNCRNVIKWTGGKGFLSLPAIGPQSGCLLGSTAPAVTLHDVTSVADCTEEAAKKFREWKE